MAKKSIKPKNSTTKYYLYSLITLFIAVGFYLFSEFYWNFSSEKTKSGTVSKMEQMIAIDEIDYSKLDDSICMLKKTYCEVPQNYSHIVDCLHSEDINVYYLKDAGSCSLCKLTPGFVFPIDTKETVKVVRCLAGSKPARVPFRVRSGAHSFGGTSFVEHGFIVDMKRMRRISVKPKKKEVVLGVGVRVGEAYQALEKYKLLVIGGDCPDVGIGGLSSTGGTGFTTRKYGVMINTVLNYKVVLPTGDVVNASFEENRDLFDVLRGTGGSSFGIITHVTLKLGPLEPMYGFLRIKIDPKSTAEWLHYFVSIADTLSDDMMYIYTYLFDKFTLVQGALTGELFSNSTLQNEVVQNLVDDAKKRGVDIISANIFKVPYTDLWKYTYGAHAYSKSVNPKSTWLRDYREHTNSEYNGVTSGYICTDQVPLEVFEKLEKHYFHPKYRKQLLPADIGTNVELFGGNTFSDEMYGVYKGKGCRAIFTTYPKRGDTPEKATLIQKFQAEFWDILRPYTNYSYRGYEDASHGRSDQGGHVGMMDFHYGESKYEVMTAKTKFDPENIFKNHLSIPTIDCYEQNLCQ